MEALNQKFTDLPIEVLLYNVNNGSELQRKVVPLHRSQWWQVPLYMNYKRNKENMK